MSRYDGFGPPVGLVGGTPRSVPIEDIGAAGGALVEPANSTFELLVKE